jgi:nucleoside phosphorylase
VIAAELLPGDHWAMTLCHEPGGVAPDELLRQASRRLVQLITAEVNRAASRLGAQAKSIDVIETLVCLRRGVTTQRMRDEVARWSQRPYASSEGWEVTMRFSGTRARTPSSRTNRAMDTGAFFFWYMLAVAVVVLVEAVFVAEWEQSQPGTACLSRPRTYGLALRWLAQRLLWTDPQGMSPVTFQAWAVGWLTSLMSLVGLGVTVVAISQYRKYRSAKAAELERFIGATDRQTQVLLMVATAAERDAVLTAVSAANDARPERRFLKDHTVFDLGQIGNAQILLAQCEQGAVGPGAAAIAAASLITGLEPDFLILTGICFGLRQDLQSLGDLVVCQQLRAIDHRKVADGEFVLVRGDHVSPSQTLLSRFRSAQVGWTKANVHFGPMLSSSVLVDSQGLRDDLLRLEPEAYGGEMEGAGVYAAASPGKVDWIVVKAICDWGHDKTDEWQELAARNAAEFVVHTIRTGALDDR